MNRREIAASGEGLIHSHILLIPINQCKYREISKLSGGFLRPPYMQIRRERGMTARLMCGDRRAAIAESNRELGRLFGGAS
jgi:hypothetical protein